MLSMPRRKNSRMCSNWDGCQEPGLLDQPDAFYIEFFTPANGSHDVAKGVDMMETGDQEDVLQLAKTILGALVFGAKITVYCRMTHSFAFVANSTSKALGAKLVRI